MMSNGFNVDTGNLKRCTAMESMVISENIGAARDRKTASYDQ